MIMCLLLCYPVFIHMSQLLSTGHPISSLILGYPPSGLDGIIIVRDRSNYSTKPVLIPSSSYQELLLT